MHALTGIVFSYPAAITTALGADDILENEHMIVSASLGGNIGSRFSPLVGIDVRSGQEVEGFPIIRVRSEDSPYAVSHCAGEDNSPSEADFSCLPVLIANSFRFRIYCRTGFDSNSLTAAK